MDIEREYQGVGDPNRKRVLSSNRAWALRLGLGCIILLVVAKLLSLSPAEEVKDDQAHVRRFCAPSSLQNPWPLERKNDRLDFVALGDWGLDTSKLHDDGPRTDWGVENLLKLAKRVGTTAKESHSAFVLNLGDNFYQYGLKSAEDERWETTFEQVFSEETDLTWYGMFGNHDYKGNLNPEKEADEGVMAQIQRTFHAKNHRWCIPSFNYTLKVETSSFDLYIVVFDSQSIVKQDPDADSGAYDGVHIPDSDRQIEWLDSTLCEIDRKRATQSKPIWLFTASHHFLMSVGKYFDRQEGFEIMRSRIEPVLLKCGVQVHFHGHDHVTQALTVAPDMETSILQLGVGSAGKLNGFVNTTQADVDREFHPGHYRMEFASKQTGFASVSLDAAKARLRLVNSDGDELISFMIQQ